MDQRISFVTLAVRDLRRSGRGGDVLGGAQKRDWGGYTGCFADPEGFRWEVAWNPGPIGPRVLPDPKAPPSPPRQRP